jgi:hypothetical protein
VQVNVRTHTVVRTVRLPRRAGVGPLRGAALDWTFQLAASPRGAWVALGADVLTRVDGRSGDVEQLPIGSTSGVAFDGRSLWSAADVEDRPGSRSGTMARVDPRTARIEEQLPLPDFGPGYPTNAIAADERAVWGVVEQAHALWRLDADSLRVTSVLSLRGGPLAIALGARGGWTANDDGTVSRVDRATGSLVATIPLGRYPRIAYPTAIATGPHAVWVTVR